MIAAAGVVVLNLAAAYLAGLGLAVLLRPAAARAFLAGFAQTRHANWIEAALRALVGVAFIVAAGRTQHPPFALVIGLFLVATAVLMLVLADAHRRFAARATASLAGVFPLFGAASLALAAALLWFIA